MKVLAVIFLFGIVACAEECPSEEELRDTPCICNSNFQKLDVKCTDGKLRVIKKALRSFSGKRNVQINLERCYLGSVPSDFFANIGVIQLYINNCDLDSLGDKDKHALIGLETTLKTLRIQSSLKKNVDPSKVKIAHLKNLTSLELIRNNITRLDNTWFFNGPTSLQKLLLQGNKIEVLGDRAFANLSNLKELSVQDNTIADIKRSMLPTSANYLETLTISTNRLTSLPQDIFSKMPSLIDVYLDSNLLTTLDQNTWKSDWEELDKVFLSGNPLVCDNNMNWTFSLRQPSTIYGTCASPVHQKGKPLRNFITEGQTERLFLEKMLNATMSAL